MLEKGLAYIINRTDLVTDSMNHIPSVLIDSETLSHIL